MSKDLDSELAAAAGLLDDDTNAAGTSAGSETAGDDSSMALASRGADARQVDADKQRRNVGLLMVLITMVVGIVALFLFGFEEAAIYSMPVDEFVSQGSKVAGKRTRIEGELVPGSLRKREKPCEYRFEIQGEKEKLTVRYPQCIVPDSFRDVPEGGVLVTAEGKLQANNQFEASLIMAKCSSKYNPETHEVEGDDLKSIGDKGKDDPETLPAGADPQPAPYQAP